MARAPVGIRIRERRREVGLTQSTLASRAGISPSYLNLIEHGKRPVGGALVKRIAEALDLRLEALGGVEDTRLLEDLTEITTDPMLRDLGLDIVGAQEIVGRRPDWARALLRLQRAQRDAAAQVEALSDRLAGDPFLLQASHELLSRITAVRSLAEILSETADLEPERRERFLGEVARESGRMGSVAHALFNHLHDLPSEAGALTPADEVDDFIIDHRTYFPDLEEAGEDLWRRVRVSAETADGALGNYLATRHRIRITVGSHDEGGEGGSALHPDLRFDRKAKELWIDEASPPATRRFQMARLIVELECGPIIEALTRDPRLTSPISVERAGKALLSYGAAAMLFPYLPFLEAAQQTRHDLEILCRRFGGSMEQICHRLATLRRAGAEGVPFAFLRVDPAGNISKRLSLADLRLPRRQGACSLWPVYRAFQNPETITVQRARFASGPDFIFIARTVSKQAASYAAPRPIYSVMIGCDVQYADQIVYADSFSGRAARLATEVGITCHLCPRLNCDQRAYPPILPPSEAPAPARRPPDGTGVMG